MAVHAGATRTETDAMGPIEGPADRDWGAQTAGITRDYTVTED